ncbi:small G protein signaling modulator 1 [Aplochiton taeniatus]
MFSPMTEAETRQKLLRNVKKEVKQIMEEAVTRKFVHADSSHIISFCAVVETCLLHGLKRRAASLLCSNKVAALFMRVGKSFKPAEELCQKVQELEQLIENNRHNQLPLSKDRGRQSKLANLSPQALKHLWIRTALLEKLLDKIILYLVENCSKFYEREAMLVDPVDGPILASLLVGPCALEYTKMKTSDHFWTDPSADELVQRHRIHSGHCRQDSPSRRPALIQKRQSSGSMDDRPLQWARDYVESLHQNSRAILLFGKNNVLVQPRDDMEAIPGYLSLHQTAEIMTLKWTPNQLMNGTVGELDCEKSVYWDFAMTIRLEEIVYLHCHQQVDSGGTVVLVSQDGIQRPPLRFPRGGHLLQFLTCLETGLLPHGQLDPPLWSQRGKGKVFPKLRNRSPQGSCDSVSDREEDEATDYVFRLLFPGNHMDFVAPELMDPAANMWHPVPRKSSCSSCSQNGSSDGSLPNGCNQDRAPLKLLCETMKYQIISRAFYGWLAYCRHLSTVRTHLSALVNHTIIDLDGPSNAQGGLSVEIWSSFLQDCSAYEEQELMRLVYLGGVAPTLRKEVWPFLLGHYQFTMTEKRRAEVDEQMKTSYEQTMKEWQGCEAIVRQRESEKHAQALARCSSGANSVEKGPVQRDSTISTDSSQSSYSDRQNAHSHSESSGSTQVFGSVEEVDQIESEPKPEEVKLAHNKSPVIHIPGGNSDSGEPPFCNLSGSSTLAKSPPVSDPDVGSQGPERSAKGSSQQAKAGPQPTDSQPPGSGSEDMWEPTTGGNNATVEDEESKARKSSEVEGSETVATNATVENKESKARKSSEVKCAETVATNATVENKVSKVLEISEVAGSETVATNATVESKESKALEIGEVKCAETVEANATEENKESKPLESREVEGSENVATNAAVEKEESKTLEISEVTCAEIVEANTTVENKESKHLKSREVEGSETVATNATVEKEESKALEIGEVKCAETVEANATVEESKPGSETIETNQTQDKKNIDSNTQAIQFLVGAESAADILTANELSKVLEAAGGTDLPVRVAPETTNILRLETEVSNEYIQAPLLGQTLSMKAQESKTSEKASPTDKDTDMLTEEMVSDKGNKYSPSMAELQEMKSQPTGEPQRNDSEEDTSKVAEPKTLAPLESRVNKSDNLPDVPFAFASEKPDSNLPAMSVPHTLQSATRDSVLVASHCKQSPDSADSDDSPSALEMEDFPSGLTSATSGVLWARPLSGLAAPSASLALGARLRSGEPALTPHMSTGSNTSLEGTDHALSEDEAEMESPPPPPESVADEVNLEEPSQPSSEVNSYSQEQLDLYLLNLTRIDKDVRRCDRTFWYFTPANLDKLRNIMCSYVWQHLDIGYVQGMCDLLAPLLVILDDEVMAFSCFTELMKRMNQNFPHGGAMDSHFANMRSLIQILDSELFELMQQNGDYTHFYFCYRWFLLDFKREMVYDDVFSVWETIWAARYTSSEQFVLFIALALVEMYRDIILENNMDFTDIIKFFNEMAERHNVQQVLTMARDLVHQVQTLIENK